MNEGFVVAAISLLVVKFLKQFQIDGVDQNHLNWMGLVFSCWIVDGFEKKNQVVAAISLLVCEVKRIKRIKKIK